MTTLPISFQIDNTKGTIRLYGFPWSITPGSLALNINFVQWDGVTNTGLIYYNDRIAIPESFPDPSPYQSYINSWMSGAASGAAPFTAPLTLSQAQAVKAGLIDSIWSVKRQAPLVVTTSLGHFTFDCNDGSNSASFSISNALPLINSTSAYANSINSAVAAVVSKFNTAFTDIAININSSGGTLASESMADFNLLASGSITSQGGQNVAWTAVPNYGTQSYSAPGALPLMSMGVEMLPIGSTSYPAFSVSDMCTIFNALEAQRSNELLVRAGKQAALAALSTVSSVIAYDVTTGW